MLGLSGEGRFLVQAISARTVAEALWPSLLDTRPSLLLFRGYSASGTPCRTFIVRASSCFLPSSQLVIPLRSISVMRKRKSEAKIRGHQGIEIQADNELVNRLIFLFCVSHLRLVLVHFTQRPE